MSKFWLLLLLVAAVQYAHAYPSEYELEDTDFASDEVELDYLEDEQTTWGILKEAWGKLKDRYKKVSREKMQKIIALLNDKFCSKENDFEDDFESDEAEDQLSKQYKIVQKIKELFEKAKAKWGEQKEKLKEETEKIKAKFCAKLKDAAEDVDFLDDDEGGDEERGIKWGKIGKKVGTGLKKAGKKLVKGLKKLKGPMKKIAKKGLEIIRKAGIKVQPLQCEGKSCKSCIILRIPMDMSFCLQMGFMRTNKATYLTVAFTKDDVPKFEERIKLGQMPRCLNVGGAIGKICLKGLEGHAKSSQGQANVNFCLAVLAENFGVGCKFCATYENKKLRVKFVPKTFAGATDENGDMVQLDKNGEDGLELGADEFEVE